MRHLGKVLRLALLQIPSTVETTTGAEANCVTLSTVREYGFSGASRMSPLLDVAIAFPLILLKSVIEGLLASLSPTQETHTRML